MASWSERGLVWLFDEKVNMITHLAVGIYHIVRFWTMSCFVLFLKCLSTQDVEKTLIVFCTLKNLLLVHSSQYCVINSCVGMFSCCTCHFYMVVTDGSMTCPQTLSPDPPMPSTVSSNNHSLSSAARWADRSPRDTPCNGRSRNL